MNIILVDDDHAGGQSLTEFLQTQGHSVRLCTNGADALTHLASDKAHLVITDLRMPGMDGLELLRRIRETPAGHDVDVIILTGFADMETAVTALRHGAYDYLRKPVQIQELAVAIERLAEHRTLVVEHRALSARFDEQVEQATRALRDDLAATRGRLRRTLQLDAIVAESAAMRAILAKAALYHAHPDTPVVLEGETGVGKDVVARLIHYGAAASEAPLVALNCSALSASLFETELFGYEAGAFSGGNPKGARGKLELAENGTLFLDEIGDLPLELQPKLLRVVQDRTFYRVGGLKKIALHARLVCATNQDLDRMITAGRFRRDLYHRLQVGHLRIPPLRDRPEDILPLAERILAREAEAKRKAFRELSAAARDLLQRHPWPGNVRELENAIQRAVLENDGTVLQPEHLAFLTAPAAVPVAAANGAPAPAAAPTPNGPAIRLGNMAVPLPADRLDLEQLGQDIIESALRRFDNNITRTAQYLGISRNSLYCRIKRGRGRNYNAISHGK